MINIKIIIVIIISLFIGYFSYVLNQNSKYKNEIKTLKKSNIELLKNAEAQEQKYLKNIEFLKNTSDKKESLSKEITKQKIKIVKVKDEALSPNLHDASEFILNRLQSKDSEK